MLKDLVHQSDVNLEKSRFFKVVVDNDIALGLSNWDIEESETKKSGRRRRQLVNLDAEVELHYTAKSRAAAAMAPFFRVFLSPFPPSDVQKRANDDASYEGRKAAAANSAVSGAAHKSPAGTARRLGLNCAQTADINNKTKQ